MKLDNYFILLFLVVFGLSACSEKDSKIKLAKEVYNNNMSGIELFDALSSDQKLLIRKKICEGSAVDENPILDTYLGRPRSNSSFKNNKIRKVKTYRTPSFLDLADNTYQGLVEFKDECSKTSMEYNKQGFPILTNSADIKYQNGKISNYGNKIYTYTDSATIISWKNEKYYEGKEWKYVYKDNALTRTEYKNGELTGNSTYFKYNADMMRQEGRSTYHREISYYTSITIDHYFYEYNDLKQLTRKLEKSERISDGENEGLKVKHDKAYTYYSNGLLESIKDSKGSFIFLNFSNKYYYKFFKDQDGLLNVHKLKSPLFFGPKSGVLTHYIFDANSNLLYSSFRNFRRVRYCPNFEEDISYFKEYEYFFVEEEH